MVRKITIIISMCFIFNGITKTQTFEEYVRQQDARFAEYAKQQEEALKKYAAEMDRRLQELDRQWTEYLKKKFDEFETKKKSQPDIGPKPKTKPVLDTKDVKKEAPKQLAAETDYQIQEFMQVVTPPLQKSIPENTQTTNVALTFYGTPVNITYSKDLAGISLGAGSISEQVISAHFAKLSDMPYSIIVNSLMEQKNELNLNDYALYMLTKQTADKITKDKNNSTFLQWFLMMKLGYKVRIGYNSQNLYLLIPTTYEIYEKPFFTLENNLKYYVIEGNVTNIFTYDKDFPEAKQIVSLDLRSPLNLKANIATKNVKFNHGGKSYSFAIEYNKNLIEFYKNYPLCDIRVQFDAGVSSQTKMSLAENFKPLIDGKSEQDAASLLLNFVQTAFEYKDDMEQFGREKFFFPEEIFHYPYSDCDDRVVFFAYLIKEFLNLDIAGIEYPGHIATAVKFSNTVAGDYFTFKGDRYTVCDPTFINAPIGMAMPQYVSQKAEFIELRTKTSTIDREQEIWALAMSGGACRGSNLKDVATDKKGNVYITGYIEGTAKIGNKTLQSFENSRDVFVASFNSKNELNWVNAFGHRGNESGYSLQIGNNGEIYVAFSFSQGFKFGYRDLKAAKKTGDIAIARLDQTGKVEWVTQLGLDEVGLTDPYIFLAELDTKGRPQPLIIFRQLEGFDKFGLQISENGMPYLAGANYATAELKTTTIELASGADFSATDLILTESSKLISDEFNPAAAGLFAAMKLINNTTISLHGTEVQKVLDKQNPNFKKTSPTVYSSLGIIQFIRNSEGIITIKTDGQKEVNFQTMRISNNARFKVSTFNSGSQQLDVMNGISLGKSIIWYNLNSLKILKTGDMVVDYDTDHTKIKMHLVKDILE